MSQFLDLVISGAVAGALYAVLASGLVLTYSTSGVFNFAHGAVAFVAALIYYELHLGAHLPIVPSALIAIVVFGPLCGVFLDRAMFRGLARTGEAAQVVATVGLSIAVPAFCIWLIERLISVGHLNLPSVDNVVTPPGIGPSPAHVFHLSSGVAISTDQIATLSAAALVAAGLWLLISRTSLGLRMRAVVDQRDLASLHRVNPDRTSGFAWSLSCLLAALAGVLGAPILSLGSTDFMLLMLVSAAAAIFARLRSIPLAFAGGLALGVIENLVAGYLDPKVHLSGLSSSMPFMLLFVGLILFNWRRGTQARTPSEEKAPPIYDADLTKWRRGAPWAVAVVVFIVYVMFIANPFWAGLMAGGLCVSLIFLSFVVVTGIGGMISLAQATFVTTAAMVAGAMLTHHIPFVVALLAGTAAAAAVGVVVALPALRLGGLTLALATLALAFIGDLLVFQIGAVNNYSLGWTLSRPQLGPLNLHSNRTMSMVILVLVGLVVLLVRNLVRSASGRAMLAVRSSSSAACASGISPVGVKLALFALSAAIAGFGGIMYASFSGAVTAGDYPAEVGLIWLAVMVTFGVRRPGYAVVAGIVYSVMPHVLTWVTSSSYIPQILFGLGGVSLARSPDGFMVEWKEKANRRRAAKRAAGAEEAQPGRPLQPQRPAEVLAPPRAPGEHVPVLELNSIEAGYDAGQVLWGVNLSIPAGTAMGLIGPNGAGKSTLALIAAGLMAPTKGRVILEGRDVTELPPHARAAAGLVLIPEARSLFRSLTVDENLRLELPDEADRKAVYDRFPLLAARRRLAAGLLSGGEQRLLALAPLLLVRPKVLIADEPSLGLAPQVVRDVFSVLGELRDDGVSLLVIEEKMRDIVGFADTLMVMELGQAESLGPVGPADVERLAARYLRGATQPQS